MQKKLCLILVLSLNLGSALSVAASDPNVIQTQINQLTKKYVDLKKRFDKLTKLNVSPVYLVSPAQELQTYKTMIQKLKKELEKRERITSNTKLPD